MAKGTITLNGDHRFDGLSIIESVIIDKVDNGDNISRSAISIMLNNGKVLLFMPYQSTSGTGVNLVVCSDYESFLNQLDKKL